MWGCLARHGIRYSAGHPSTRVTGWRVVDYNHRDERWSRLDWDGNESLSKLGGGSQAFTTLMGDQSQRSFRMGGGTNTLLSRFINTPTFYALYEQKLEQVYQQVYASGAITAPVEHYAALVRSANPETSLVDMIAYETAASSVLDFITAHMEYLNSD